MNGSWSGKPLLLSKNVSWLCKVLHYLVYIHRLYLEVKYVSACHVTSPQQVNQRILSQFVLQANELLHNLSRYLVLSLPCKMDV